MKILHLSNTCLAGAPVHLSNIINKYTEHESKTVLLRYFKNKALNNLNWEFNYVSPEYNIVEDLVKDCDIIHYHNYPHYDNKVFDKPSILQFHSQPECHPNGYVPNQTYSDFNGRKLVVSQYHPRFFSDSKIIPNMIDIWGDDYVTSSNIEQDKISIYFGYAFESSGWGYKGVSEVTSILKSYYAKYNINIITNVPYSEMMKIKKSSDIIIGDIFTGSYHLSELEGAALGKIVLNHMDMSTQMYMKTISETDTYPFQETIINTLTKNLDYYLKNIDLIKAIGIKNRAWMEKYWDPKELVKKYIICYNSILEKGIIL